MSAFSMFCKERSTAARLPSRCARSDEISTGILTMLFSTDAAAGSVLGPENSNSKINILSTFMQIKGVLKFT